MAETPVDTGTVSEQGEQAVVETPSRTDVRTEIALPEADKQAFLAEMIRSDAVSFARLFAPDDQMPARHHELMLREIQSLFDNRSDVLLIAMPPGSGKSHYATIIAALYFLARRPDANVLLCAATATLASSFSRRVRNFISDARFPSVARGNATLDGDSTAADNFSLTYGGSLRAFGTGAAILGQRADLILLDDIVVSFEQAMSQTQLAKLADWLKGDVLTRLKPAGKIICVCQRLAHEDGFGFLSRHFTGTSVRVREIILRMEAEGDDPLGRQVGARLWPEWFDERHVEVAKLDPVRWQTLQQQRPLVSLGEWLPESHLRIDQDPPPLNQMGVYIGVDFASGSSAAGDFTAIVVVGVRMDEAGHRHLHVLEVFRQRLDPRDGVDQMIAIAKKYNVRHVLVDNDLFFKSMKSFVHERMDTTGYSFRFEGISLGGKSKEERASPLRAVGLDGRLHLLRRPWLEPLLSEIRSFPLATGFGVDDQIDALGLIPRFIGKTNAPLPKVEKMVTLYLPDGTEIQRPEGWGLGNWSPRDTSNDWRV